MTEQPDWQRFANLASQTEEAGVARSPTFEIDLTSSLPTQLEPLLPEEEQASEEPITVWSFTRNRLPYIVLVAGAGVAGMMGMLMANPFSAPAPTPTLSPAPQEAPPDSKQEEIGELKSKLALQEQKRRLAQAQKQSATANPPNPTVTNKRRQARLSSPPKGSSVRAVQPPSPPVVPPPQPSPVIRSVRRSPVFESDRRWINRPFSETVSATRSVPPPLTASVPAWQNNSDPQQAQQTWLMAARLGSYGENSEEAPVEEISPVGSGDTEFYGTDAADEFPVQVAAVDDGIEPQSRSKALANVPEINLERSVLEGRPLHLLELSAGTLVRGRLLNAIVWDDSQLVEGSRVRIELQEDLRDRSGQVLVAAGEQVSAQIIQARASGIVLLSVEELPLAEGPMPLNLGTLVVQQPDGMPLVAERRHQGNEEGGVDWGSFALDLFGAVTPLLGGGGGNDYSRDAFQFDRFENLYEQHFQRQDSHAARQSVREVTIWQIPAGTEVELMVREGVKIYQ